MKRFLQASGAWLLGMVLLLALICAVGRARILDAGLMSRGFDLYAVTEPFGVARERYPDYASGIVRFLSGEGDAVQVPQAGKMTDAFSAKENAHMNDVRGIVSLVDCGRWAGLAALIATAALYALAGTRRRAVTLALAKGLGRASITLLTLALLLIITGAADFYRLFYAFHQLVFTNDLWLLNPKTDLLIAMMPQSCFVWYAQRILLALLPVLCIIAASAAALISLRKRK